MNNFELICAVLSSAAYREKRNRVNRVETPSGVQDGVGAGKYTLDPASGFLFGEAGKDVLDGVAGDDVLLGGAGDDELQGGAGNDAVAGDEGSDRLFGEAGDDVITGAAGDDLV